MEKKFTVFTPTFNRAHTLYRVFESLNNQTFKDFEWLIIDDGSIDGTKELVNTWIKSSSYLIRYYYQANQGKHNAMVDAINLANGEFFLSFDSDDRCTDNALERLLFNWNTIPLNLQSSFSAVTTLCMNEEGEPLTKKLFPVKESNTVEMNFKYHFNTEAWGFQRTAVLKELNLVKELEGKYLLEVVFWNRISSKYKTLYINEYLRYYYVGHTSISNSKIENSAEGQIIYILELFNNHFNIFKYSKIKFCLYAINLSFFFLYTNHNLMYLFERVNKYYLKFLIGIFIPLGLVKYLIRNKWLKK